MGEPTLDPIIHAPVRLAILSALLPVEEIAFVELRSRLGTTDGNLSAHVGKLEAAGYVEVRKQFAERKPLTTYRLTEVGRRAFMAYLTALEALLPPRG